MTVLCFLHFHGTVDSEEHICHLQASASLTTSPSLRPSSLPPFIYHTFCFISIRNNIVSAKATMAKGKGNKRTASTSPLSAEERTQQRADNLRSIAERQQQQRQLQAGANHSSVAAAGPATRNRRSAGATASAPAVAAITASIASPSAATAAASIAGASAATDAQTQGAVSPPRVSQRLRQRRSLATIQRGGGGAVR